MTDTRTLNTLGVPFRPRAIWRAASEAELERLLLGALERGERFEVIGGGSNIVPPARLDAAVCLVRMRGIEHRSAGARTVAVSAAAGESWHGLVRHCLGRGWAGLENLSLIPGSVGAAPLQNIGAYGVELAQRMVSLRALDLEAGRYVELDTAACGFGYRDSLFKTGSPGRYVITRVTLSLATARSEPVLDYPDVRHELARLGITAPNPVQVAEAVIRVRRRKLPDPRFVGNVGSFFKNPVVPRAHAERLQSRVANLVTHASGGGVKLSAAQLIDLAGWKGHKRGPVGVWPRQPLVLVNLGGACGADFLALGREIQRDVAARFDVALEMEPTVLAG